MAGFRGYLEDSILTKSVWYVDYFLVYLILISLCRSNAVLLIIDLLNVIIVAESK